MKKYVWHVYRLDFYSGKWTYKTDFRAGSTEKSAFTEFNSNIADTLEDGQYACQRRIPKRDGSRPMVFVEVYR